MEVEGVGGFTISWSAARLQSVVFYNFIPIPYINLNFS